MFTDLINIWFPKNIIFKLKLQISIQNIFFLTNPTGFWMLNKFVLDIIQFKMKKKFKKKIY